MEKDSYNGGGGGSEHYGDGSFYPLQNENPPPYYQPQPPPQQPGLGFSHHNSYQPVQQSQQQQPIQTHTVIQVVNQPIPPQLGPNPARTLCPYCHEDIVTRTRRVYTSSTHICACMLSFMCCCCFAWMPYFTDCCSMNDIEHECPNCDKFLGVFSRNYSYARR